MPRATEREARSTSSTVAPERRARHRDLPDAAAHRERASRLPKGQGVGAGVGEGDGAARRLAPLGARRPADGDQAEAHEHGDQPEPDDSPHGATVVQGLGRSRSAARRARSVRATAVRGTIPQMRER